MGHNLSQVFDVDDTTSYPAIKEVVHPLREDVPPPKEAWLLHPDSSIPEHTPHINNKIYFQEQSAYTAVESMPANLIVARTSWSEINHSYNIR